MNSRSDEDDLDINDLLSSYLEDTTQFIARPDTIKQMVKDGLKLDEPEELTKEQYIERLFAKKQKHALSLIEQMPMPPRIALPPIISLYAEIRECILFGLNGAAITLSAVLVEFAIKHAIVDHTSGVEVYDGEEWDRLEKKELGPVIAEAAKHQLFDEEAIRRLVTFKNEVRNPYLHYNIKKITTGVVLPKAYAYDTKINKIVEKYDLKAEENPFLWQVAKKHVDEQMVLDIFRFADSVVRRLFKEED